MFTRSRKAPSRPALIGAASLTGLALAATCGLRAFLPLFTLSGLSLAGKVSLGAGYDWMGTWPAALAFGVAVVLELVGDKFPAVDHALVRVDREGKPVGIHKFIGKRPIMAFGNSDGDFQILELMTVYAPAK